MLHREVTIPLTITATFTKSDDNKRNKSTVKQIVDRIKETVNTDLAYIPIFFEYKDFVELETARTSYEIGEITEKDIE